MQHLTRSDLLAARDALRLADVYLSRTRGIFIRSGHGEAAAACNALIKRLASLLGKVEKALLAKP
jgi:hypothetical protein